MYCFLKIYTPYERVENKEREKRDTFEKRNLLWQRVKPKSNKQALDWQNLVIFMKQAYQFQMEWMSGGIHVCICCGTHVHSKSFFIFLSNQFVYQLWNQKSVSEFKIRTRIIGILIFFLVLFIFFFFSNFFLYISLESSFDYSLLRVFISCCTKIFLAEYKASDSVHEYRIDYFSEMKVSLFYFLHRKVKFKDEKQTDSSISLSFFQFSFFTNNKITYTLIDLL